MNWPEDALIWKAIDCFLREAYGASLPATVSAKIDALRQLHGLELLACRQFERTGHDASQRLMLRLGNRFYPHMKLAIENRPDGLGVLFRADTHDAHCCPAAGSPEHDAFRQLMERNQAIAHAIELAWEAAGIPTFKAWLREDLARRAAKK